MIRNSPFDPYIIRVRNDQDTAALQLKIREDRREDTPRYRRAERFAQLVQSLMAEFIPTESRCRRMIHERLFEAGFAGNCEIINVPLECDELDKLALERRMLEAKMTPIVVEKKS
ncbi:hypothetical protein ACRQ5Q_22590 [Bradyrhizobium sp. PMVTL-01]|uniref:hypothetical protein n=1 Tax=Bradyrhizobium sp. PMVTL-01 TaxID=3434999 RepID=UPI003F72A23E